MLLLISGLSYAAITTDRLISAVLNTVLNGVALVLNLNALGQKALAALGTTTGEDGTTILGSHACAETELALAAALGRLVCSLAHIDVWLRLKFLEVCCGRCARSGSAMILKNQCLSSTDS